MWAPDGYEHGLALPFMKLSLDEDTAVQQIADAIDWLNDYYQKSDDEYKALMARMFTKQNRPATLWATGRRWGFSSTAKEL